MKKRKSVGSLLYYTIFAACILFPRTASARKNSKHLKFDSVDWPSLTSKENVLNLEIRIPDTILAHLLQDRVTSLDTFSHWASNAAQHTEKRTAPDSPWIEKYVDTKDVEEHLQKHIIQLDTDSLFAPRNKYSTAKPQSDSEKNYFNDESIVYDNINNIADDQKTEYLVIVANNKPVQESLPMKSNKLPMQTNNSINNDSFGQNIFTYNVTNIKDTNSFNLSVVSAINDTQINTSEVTSEISTTENFEVSTTGKNVNNFSKLSTTLTTKSSSLTPSSSSSSSSSQSSSSSSPASPSPSSSPSLSSSLSLSSFPVNSQEADMQNKPASFVLKDLTNIQDNIFSPDLVTQDTDSKDDNSHTKLEESAKEFSTTNFIPGDDAEITTMPYSSSNDDNFIEEVTTNISLDNKMKEKLEGKLESFISSPRNESLFKLSTSLLESASLATLPTVTIETEDSDENLDNSDAETETETNTHYDHTPSIMIDQNDGDIVLTTTIPNLIMPSILNKNRTFVSPTEPLKNNLNNLKVFIDLVATTPDTSDDLKSSMKTQVTNKQAILIKDSIKLPENEQKTQNDSDNITTAVQPLRTTTKFSSSSKPDKTPSTIFKLEQINTTNSQEINDSQTTLAHTEHTTVYSVESNTSVLYNKKYPVLSVTASTTSNDYTENFKTESISVTAAFNVTTPATSNILPLLSFSSGHNPTMPESDFANIKIVKTDESKIISFINDFSPLSHSYHHLEDHIQASNILSPSQIAESLQDSSSLKEAVNEETTEDDLYYDAPVYLEDLPKEDYDYEQTVPMNVESDAQTAVNNQLVFPTPNVTGSYSSPSHISTNGHNDTDPSSFLPKPSDTTTDGPLSKVTNSQSQQNVKQELDPAIMKYIDALNDVSFQAYRQTAKLYRRQNMVLSTFNLIATLSLLRLGARGRSADALSFLLQSENQETFNPHLFLKNVSNGVVSQEKKLKSAFVNQIFVEKAGSSLGASNFYSQMASHFYNASVVGVPKGGLGDSVRDNVNKGIVNQAGVQHFLRPDAALSILGPLGVVGSCYWQSEWGVPLTESDLYDMNFIRFPSAERRLIKTVGIRKSILMKAGYSSLMDATVAEIPLANKDLSLVFVMPGQQKSFVANGLAQMESRLNSSSWKSILNSLREHNIDLRVPFFSHRNYLNISASLASMGMEKLFQKGEADFSGILRKRDLHLGDVIQLVEFHSSGFSPKSSQSDPLPYLRPPKFKSKKLSLSYDRAFFYVIKHNPTGLVLIIGRYLDPETF